MTNYTYFGFQITSLQEHPLKKENKTQNRLSLNQSQLTPVITEPFKITTQQLKFIDYSQDP
jgi:hypothetical protein